MPTKTPIQVGSTNNTQKEADELLQEEKIPACYRTDRRYLCQGRCKWAYKCKKLIAEWLR